jgi:hypothetical protein
VPVQSKIYHRKVQKFARTSVTEPSAYIAKIAEYNEVERTQKAEKPGAQQHTTVLLAVLFFFLFQTATVKATEGQEGW